MNESFSCFVWLKTSTTRICKMLLRQKARISKTMHVFIQQAVRDQPSRPVGELASAANRSPTGVELADPDGGSRCESPVQETSLGPSLAFALLWAVFLLLFLVPHPCDPCCLRPSQENRPQPRAAPRRWLVPPLRRPRSRRLARALYPWL